MEDVQVPRLGKVSDGEVTVDFGVAGLEEFMIIHLLGLPQQSFHGSGISPFREGEGL